MQNNAILVHDLTAEDLKQLICQSVKSGIDDLQRKLQLTNDKEELLTREETCQFLKIDSSTLWAWTNKKKVKAYGIGARRYYKRSELMQSLTLLKK